MKIKLLSLLFVLTSSAIYAQSISSEKIEVQSLKQPKNFIDPNSRQLKVTVASPYNLTADDVIRNSKNEHQKALDNYDNDVLNSQRQFQAKLKEFEADQAKAKEKYEFEMVQFKKLSIIERMTMTDQGKNPKLASENKPEYYKPLPPIYREPDLNDYIIVDNNVLASQININGFTKGNSYVDVLVDIKAVNFQDNAGQTYANQPTKIIVKVNGVEKSNASFFTEFKYISSSPTNNINKPREEKNHLNGVVGFINQYLNDNYGYTVVRRDVEISKVKNKGKYDDLEKAHIYVTTNLKKLQPAMPEENTVALANMKKGTDIWLQTLEKIDFKDSKSDFNAKIAEFIYINLIRLNLALNNKVEAEKYLNQYQENQIYMKLSSDDKKELDSMEKEIYNKK
jgi:hypothetical protein